ncbi:MAG TPA: hypothetical protein VHC20_05805 [Candidatus Paceibacterota bacterium]|nr:hypothetical protein [Candidatus Paceibacterota bacterium]
MLKTIYHIRGWVAAIIGAGRILDAGSTIGDSSVRALMDVTPEEIVCESWALVYNELSRAHHRVISAHPSKGGHDKTKILETA